MVGGKIGKQEQVTSSATTLVSGKGRWSPAIAPLPVAVYGLRVVSLNNQIIAIGLCFSMTLPISLEGKRQ